jgi:hypothetical protein
VRCDTLLLSCAFYSNHKPGCFGAPGLRKIPTGFGRKVTNLLCALEGQLKSHHYPKWKFDFIPLSNFRWNTYLIWTLRYVLRFIQCATNTVNIFD